MSGGKGDSTTKQTNTPWKEAQPYLKEILSGASDVYGQGSSFVGANPYQTQGLEQMAGMAQQGSPLAQQAPGAVGDILSSGGMNQQQQDVAGSLMPYATGQYLGGGNPYLDDIIDRNTQDITEGVKSASQGLGRSGGNAYNTGEMTRGIGEMMNDLRYGDYNQQVQNQFGAANQLFGANAQGQQQALSAASLAPGMNEFRYADPSKLSQVGGQLRAFDQQQVDAPWSDLQKYAGLINQTTQPFGTSTATQSGGSDPFSAILGGLSLGASFLSDERTKTDINRVGKTDKGTPIYTYEYKHLPGVKQMGVMAQELAEKQPEAVEQRPDGLMAVNYSKVR